MREDLEKQIDWLNRLAKEISNNMLDNSKNYREKIKELIEIHKEISVLEWILKLNVDKSRSDSEGK